MGGYAKRLTLGEGLATLAAVSLMAAVAPPSLQALRARLAPVICANNLRTCHQAWNVYGRQYGVWMAPWDQANMLADDSYPYDQHWPYTMNVYAAGYALPEGEDVYEPTLGGWWSPEGRGSTSGVPIAAPLKCPTLRMRPVANSWWKPWTSYSYAIMGGHVEAEGGVDYAIGDYPLPDAMTHPATTVLLHDAVLPYPESSDWSAWSRFYGVYPGATELIPTDPHDGKSNYLFCDGYVELLAVEALNETMWMSRWVPDEPAGP